MQSAIIPAGAIEVWLSFCVRSRGKNLLIVINPQALPTAFGIVCGASDAGESGDVVPGEPIGGASR
jgi:hypothetical protein